MAEVAFTSPDTDALLARLTAIAAALPVAARAAAETIAAETEAALVTPALYGPHLGKPPYWTVVPLPAAPPILAGVRASSDHSYVRGFEFGTRPHPILPVSRAALRFTVSETVVFAKSVAHPGTKPHDRRDLLRASMALSAETQFRAAIDAALSV